MLSVFTMKSKKLSKLTAVAIMLLVASLCVGLQVGSIYGTIEADRQGLTGVVAFMGILPAVLIDIGFLPQYWEVWVTKSASGISYGFLVMDTLGSIFAILALFSTNILILSLPPPIFRSLYWI
ncbi:hypothetical protein BDF19DRAFT_4271 [Syncephalis fuscata]|nr:hypothetical protein BDF19DRAFT_4271 [Syncephalis fuscata]